MTKWHWAALVAAIAIVLMFIFNPFNCGKDKSVSDTPKVSSDSLLAAYKAALGEKDSTIASQNKAIISLSNQKLSITVKNSCPTTGDAASNDQNKKPVSKKQSAQKETTVKRQEYEIGRSDSLTIRATKTKDKFCLLVDDGYWPDVVGNIASFKEAIDNKVGGYDLLCKKIPEIEGDYGITNDDIIFVKVSVIQEYCTAIPKVISPISGGTLKPMKLETINGVKYYTYRK
jgi:hypothetical protein